MSEAARRYLFGDASSPGVLLGLPLRQAVPVIAGIVWLAACLQTPLGLAGGALGLLAGGVAAFGRWRGAPLADTAVPALRLALARRAGRARWHRPALLGTVGNDATAGNGVGAKGAEGLPPQLQGLELIEARPGGPDDGVAAGSVAGVTAAAMAIVRDRRRRLLTAAFAVTGSGFPLASAQGQDRMLAGWGAALSPLARDGCPVIRVAWQAWGGPAEMGEHEAFVASTGATARARRGDPAAEDYLALVGQQAPATRRHRVVVAVTVDERRVPRGSSGCRLDAAVDALDREVARLRQRLEDAGLDAGPPLTPARLTTLVRLRSDPTRAGQLARLAGSLAAAAGRASVEWGPMVVEPAWGHVRVDGSWHRTYRVARWPQLPVPADWLGALLGEATTTRTVCVVMEPVPLSRSARAADREAMAREADADSKARRGFRPTAMDRKRLARVEDRERELAEGHAEFRFTGLIDLAASETEELVDAAAAIEQAAAQSLVDLRPLEARHDTAWVACLPLGRDVAGRGGPP